MVDLLRAGTVKALVMDQLLLEYQASWDCNLFTVGTPFNTAYMAFAFPGPTPNDDVGAFSGDESSEWLTAHSLQTALPRSDNYAAAALVAAEAIIALDRQRDMLTKYADQFVNNALGDSCGLASLANSVVSTTQLTFTQVAGLWVILAGSVALALFLILVRLGLALFWSVRQAHLAGLAETSNNPAKVSASLTSDGARDDSKSEDGSSRERRGNPLYYDARSPAGIENETPNGGHCSPGSR